MGKAASASMIVVAAVVIVGAIVFAPQLQAMLGGFKFESTPIDKDKVPSGGGNFFGYAVSLSASGLDPQNGTLSTTNAELLNSDGSNKVTETLITGLTSMSTSLPNKFDGFVMMGNDNYESSTDRGIEYYYRKSPKSWSGDAGLVTADKIQQDAEGTLTLTGYDDGTAESTINISIGAGSRVTTTELRIEVSANGVFGNRDPLLLAEAQTKGLTIGNRPVAVCLNESTVGRFDAGKTKPAASVKEIPIPGFLSGRQVLSCNVLDTPSLVEGTSTQFYRFFINLETKAGQNPAIAEWMAPNFLDLTWVKDDNSNWVPGWGDESDNVADTDAGHNSDANSGRIELS